MKRIQFIANIGAAIALTASTAVLDAEPLLYSTTGGGSTLVRIDVGAGTVTTIGTFGVPGADAIALSPKGKLYTVTQGWPPGGDPQLASVDVATGLATPFGINLNPEIFMGIGFSRNGKLYGVNADSGTPDQNSLYRFDLTTGKAKKVGVTGGCGDIMDLAEHPDGTMYGAAWDSLFRINLHTGQAELVAKFQGLGCVMGLAIDDDGNFYVTEICPDNSPLWRVDPVTGAATAVAGVSLSSPHGLEFIPTDADEDQNHGDATVNFTKWVTAFPNMVGEITGGDVGDGEYTGEILSRVVDSQGVIRIEADYHLHGSKHSFTARIHAEQQVAGIGQQGTIIGVVTDGWLKGHAVEGGWTVIPPCGYQGGIGLGNCFNVTLNIIKRHSKD